MSKTKVKTLSKTDPHLVEAVGRHERAQKTTGWILIAFGLLAQFVGISSPELHPVAGLPFIAIGLFMVLWGDPALLAAAGMLFALSCIPTLNTALTLPGPDPIVQLTQIDSWELVIVVGVKAVMAYSAVQQFFQFRLLYGTERMTSSEENLPIIPPLVINRTDVYARWARVAGVIGAVCAALALAAGFIQPGVLAGRILAELGSALAGVALGLGFGAAFSPTDERPAALVGMGSGLIGYILAVSALLI